MVSFCASTRSPVKACMCTGQRRKAVRCNVDSDMHTAAKADSALAFDSQVSSQKSDVSGSSEVRAAAEMFKNKRAALLAQKGPL